MFKVLHKFESKISRTIKVYRKKRKIKQSTVANTLEVNQSTYSRIEKGELTITLRQLDAISQVIQTPLLEIIAYAETYGLNKSPCTALTEILIKFIYNFDAKEQIVSLSDSELDLIVFEIRSACAKIQENKYAPQA